MVFFTIATPKPTKRAKLVLNTIDLNQRREVKNVSS